MQLLKVQSVEAVRQQLKECAGSWAEETEWVSLGKSLGRILSEDIFTQEDVPGFDRSTVDGYAIKSGDTNAAGESIPAILTVIGSVEMGQAAKMEISPGQCVEVPTGAMLPIGADAVVMVEHTEDFGNDSIGVYENVSFGENTVRRGEDINKGQILLSRGKRISAQEIGALAAAGVYEVPVYAKIRLSVISTGDELVNTQSTPLDGQVRDINTHALSALAEKNGFSVVHTEAIGDDPSMLEESLRRTMVASDLVVVSGGSSQGKKDLTRAVIDKVSAPGVFTHGMAIKPGKPTIAAYDKDSDTLMAGLPGHPVSAMMIFEILFCWLQRTLTGANEHIRIPAKLAVNLPSSPGKSTYWPVKLKMGVDGYIAEPSFGKSGLITTITQADGYISSERNSEGILAGTTVYVTLM